MLALAREHPVGFGHHRDMQVLDVYLVANYSAGYQNDSTLDWAMAHHDYELMAAGGS